MKQLYLIRHAKSSWDYPELKDIAGARGLKDAPIMAQLLKKEGIIPDKLISSPANRAHSTARFFAQALNIPLEDILLDPRIYHAYAGDILNIARYWPDDWNTVFLFGHNPTFTDVANYFSDEFIANVPTCGIVEIHLQTVKWGEVGERNGQVHRFWQPKKVRR